MRTRRATRSGPPFLPEAGKIATGGAAPELDLSLLRGFRFTCRPDCGLCCYAEPRVEPLERTGLLQIAPSARFRGRGGAEFLAARSPGGACQFLTDHRCRVHAFRPHPCREYPVVVHVGRRLQASAVLSCPGVDLEALDLREPPFQRSPPVGLDDEIAAVRSRIAPTTRRRLADATRRGRRIERELRRQGRWTDEEEVRIRFRKDPPRPGVGDFPVEEPPSREEGLERLPIFFDARPGPVAIAAALGGWELLELDPEGRVQLLDLVVPPARPPELSEGAGERLAQYLRYWVERDAFLASAELEALEATEGSVLDWAEAGLRAIAATTVARAYVRAKLRGGTAERLSAEDLGDGIRAVDQDWLDRPTWGDRL